MALAQLGSILEIEVQGVILTWRKDECPVFWLEQKKAIVWFDCDPANEAPASERSSDRKAINAFERFNDRSAANVKSLKYNIRGEWLDLGRARRIDYHSDKWGEECSYTHKLGANVHLYRQGPAKGPWLYVVRGGRLRCTERGLVG